MPNITLNELTQEQLKDFATYEPETGLFRRNYDGGGRKAGSIMGTLDHTGYIHIMVRSKVYLAHRLAWLYMTGDWPVDEIDHIDRIKDNNIWENLRGSTRSASTANTIFKPGASGMRGVRQLRNSTKWQALISVDKRQRSLGSFDTKEEAHEAYLRAREKYFGEFNPPELLNGELL